MPAWPPIITLLPIVELPANPTWPVIIQFFPIFTLWAIWTWLSKKQLLPIIVLDNEPRSIVLLHPTSTLFPIMTMPICGYRIFLFLFGKKPNPFFPIIAPSSIDTLLPINDFLIITFDPILQLFPILTLLSIIELWPIVEFFPILTFSPNITFDPNLTFLYIFFLSILIDSFSNWSLREFG